MKSGALSSSLPNPDFRLKLSRLLQISIARLSALAAHARRLRDRVAHSRSHGPLCSQIDALVKDLYAAVRMLSARAAVLGTPVLDTGRLLSRPASARKMAGKIFEATADLASAVIADCQACGTRLCQLMQAAQAAHDQSSAQVAYVLLRTLEKQLWLLRPHTAGSAHPFPFATST